MASVLSLMPCGRSSSRCYRPAGRDRAALTGILFVLRTGIRWEMLPLGKGCGSGITCWRRLRDRQEADVWNGLYSGLLSRLRTANRIYWSRACIDSASFAAKRGVTRQGRTRPIGGRLRTKRHLVTDRNGIPLAFVLTGANTNDSIPPIGDKTGRPRPSPRQAPRRKGVRPSALPSWHRPPHRQARRRDQPEARPTSMGHRAELCLDQPPPPPRHPLRVPKRHPSCFYHSRLRDHLLQHTPGQVLKGALRRRPCRRERVSDIANYVPGDVDTMSFMRSAPREINDAT